MRDRKALRERYLRDGLPVRLGGVAANLARITALSGYVTSRGVVESLLDESRFLIEWTAGDAGIDTAAELVELQVQLARWQYNLGRLWTSAAQRGAMAEQAHAWSERVLEMSGLLG